MNKYVVKVSSIFSNIIPVEAENEEDAREKAREFIMNASNESGEDTQITHYYESTISPEHWSVITQEKYEDLKKQIKSQIDGRNNESDIA